MSDETQEPEVVDLNNAKKVIRNVAVEVLSLEKQRDAINAEIREAKSRLKGLGIKMADFQVVYRLFKLEIEDRNEALDSIRTVARALNIGGQGNLFPAGEENPLAPGTEPDTRMMA